MSLDKTLLTLTALRDNFKNFMETGSILDSKKSGRPSIDEETVGAMRVAFHCSPRKSIWGHFIAAKEKCISSHISWQPRKSAINLLVKCLLIRFAAKEAFDLTFKTLSISNSEKT